MPEFIKNSDDIVLNTHDEVDQILGRPPSWTLQWGISMIFVVVLILAVIAWFIKYPDVINAKVGLITEQPAIRVVAQSSGKLEQLFFKNNDFVVKNDIIAVLESSTSLEEIQKLRHFLDTAAEFSTISPNEELILGNLQPSYTLLVQKLQDYGLFYQQRGTLDKIKLLKAQIERIQKLSSNLLNQRKTMEEEVHLIEKKFNRSKKLYEEKVISVVDLEKTEAEYLQYKRQLDNMENQIVNNEISIEQLKVRIIDLEQNRINDLTTRQSSIQQTIDGLKGEIKIWEENYLVKAPISGKTSFTKFWSEQQFINVGEKILTIVPQEGTGDIIGKAVMPIANSGKVKKGQKVNIRLDGFPAQEYGILKGEVQNISLVPVSMSNSREEETYLVELKLNNDLITTYNKTITFRQEMQGIASIITEDRRVLERIFDRVKSILKNI